MAYVGSESLELSACGVSPMVKSIGSRVALVQYHRKQHRQVLGCVFLEDETQDDYCSGPKQRVFRVGRWQFDADTVDRRRQFGCYALTLGLCDHSPVQGFDS